MKSVLLQYLLVVLSCACFASALDAQKLELKIDELMNNNLGVRFIKDHYDKLAYKSVQLNGQILLDTLVNGLTAKIRKVRTALENWQKTVEGVYATEGSNPAGEDRDLILCCKYPYPTQFNYQFEIKVDLNGVCEITPYNESLGNTKFKRLKQETVKSFLARTYQDMVGNSLHIYYGQEDGYFLQYPATHTSDDCYSFDPRTRPWYVSAATQKRKDVVVLVDVSKNIDVKMTNELVTTFLKTLETKDKIAVIPFAATPFSNPDSCYNSQLVKASPANVLAIQTFVKSKIAMATSGNAAYDRAMYNLALTKAFDKFVSGDQTREKLIFLVSGGRPNDANSEIMRAIVNGNKKVSFKAVISVFVINTASNLNLKIHNDIVKQSCAGYLQSAECAIVTPKPPEGKFVHVSNKYELETKVGSFYNFLTLDKSKANIQFSFPYVDFFGAGVLIAASLPTYKGSALRGVVSIDLIMSELLSDVEYFKEGHNAYRFLIGSTGLVYEHPLLPKPVLVYEPTVPMDISLFETGAGFSTIRDSMMAGGSGNMSLVTNRSISRGDSSTEGAIGVTKTYTYYWKQVPLTNLSLAVVIETANSVQHQLKSGIASVESMVYHKLGKLDQSKYPFCRRSNFRVLNATSAIKLPSDAFTSPAKYYVQETKTTVNEMMSYFNTAGKAVPNMLESQSVASGLKNSISATSGLDAFWRNNSSPYVGWRYIATEDGIFRIFPGVEIHPLYDPRSRPWYQRSLIYPDTTVISTPYVDATTHTRVITFSYLIEKKMNNSQTTAAVMGLDYSIYHFKKLLFENVADCRDKKSSHLCIVIDKSGLIVFHPDFTDASKSQNIEGQHITEKAPDVALDLINDNHLQMKSCIGIYKTSNKSTIAKPHLYYFYELNVKRTIVKTAAALRYCPEYTLKPLPKTNVYVLVVRDRCVKTKACPCKADKTCSVPLTSYPCHCPCKHFLTCDEHLKTLQTTLVCPPIPVNLLLAVKNETERKGELNETMKFKRCHDPKCRNITTLDNCDKFGCQWCSRNSTGSLLSIEKQRCDYSEACPNGQLLPVKPPTPRPTTPRPPYVHKPPEKTPVAAIVAPIVVVVVLIAAAILGYVFWKRRKERERSEGRSQNVKNTTIANQNVVDFPLSEHGRNGVMF